MMNKKMLVICFIEVCMLLSITAQGFFYNEIQDISSIKYQQPRQLQNDEVCIKNTTASLGAINHSIPIYGSWQQELDVWFLTFTFNFSVIHLVNVSMQGSVNEHPDSVKIVNLPNPVRKRVRIQYPSMLGSVGSGLQPGSGLLCSLIVNIPLNASFGTYDLRFDADTKYKRTSDGAFVFPGFYNGTLDIVNMPTVWRNQQQNADTILPGEKIRLSAEACEDIALDYAYLSTNETGEWKNYTNLLNWTYAKKVTIPVSSVHAPSITSPNKDCWPYLPITICEDKNSNGWKNESGQWIWMNHIDDFRRHAQPDGDDFLFMDETNTTSFPYEIEYYNATTGEVCIWVNVTNVYGKIQPEDYPAKKDTTFYMYYGNPSMENSQRPYDVWDTNHLAVLHMTGENWTDLKDSTPNGWDITSAYAALGGANESLIQYNVDGISGRAVSFGMAVNVTWIGNDSYYEYRGGSLYCGNFRLPADSSYTIMAWLCPHSRYYDNTVWCTADSKMSELFWKGEFGYGGMSGGGGWLYRTECVPPYGLITWKTPFQDRVPEHWTERFIAYNSTTHGWIVPGVYIMPIHPTVEVNNGFFIGSNNKKTIFFDGSIDEVQISKVPRSVNWLYSVGAHADLGSEYLGGKASTGLYDSPQKLKENTAWQNTRFIWQNKEIPVGRTIGWKITYVDVVGEKTSTDVMSFSIGTPQPDLDAQGSLSWTNVQPGETRNGTFYIHNNGDPGSSLGWKVTGTPEWGTWTFTPSEGAALSVENGEIPVAVQVITPTQQDTTFTGEIRVENTENSNDYATIPLRLTTSHKSSTYHDMVSSLFEKMRQKHPFIRWFVIQYVYPFYFGGERQ